MSRRRHRREAPPLMPLCETQDNLKLYDRYGQPIGHVLRNLWGNTAAFLVCSGPSLNRLPIERLLERGIASLGINNVAGFAPVRAMAFGDPPEKFHHGILLDPGIMKFCPVRCLGKRVRAKLPDGSFAFTNMRVSDCPSVFGYDRTSHFSAQKFFTNEAATWGNNQDGARKTNGPKILFTFFVGFRLLHYFGVRRVYMLGVDFAMQPGNRKVGNYAFEQAGAGDGNNDHYRAAIPLLRQLKEVFDNEGFEVFNCNQESKLTLWPHVAFEEAIEDCRGNVPREPFDLANWYEKEGDEGRDVRGDPVAS